MTEKKFITIKEAIEDCEKPNALIPSDLIKSIPNQLGINLVSVKGFNVEIEDGCCKSLTIEFDQQNQKQTKESILKSLRESQQIYTSYALKCTELIKALETDIPIFCKDFLESDKYTKWQPTMGIDIVNQSYKLNNPDSPTI